MMEESDNDYFKEKLQEDIWDLNDAITRITNDVNEDVEGDS
jgi:hypothetical protein